MSTKTTLLQAFTRCARMADAEWEMAKLVGSVVDRAMQPEDVDRLFAELCHEAEAQGVAGRDELLQFFLMKGFGQGWGGAADLTHSSLEWALRTGAALPIVIAVLLIQTARRLGLEAEGINFPGHFLLNIQSELVDPISLQVIKPPSLKDAPSKILLRRASTRMIGLRMLNNIKNVYLGLQDWRNVLEITDYQMAIASQDAQILASLHFERGECWQRLASKQAAIDEYVACMAISDDQDLSAEASNRVETLSGAPAIVH
ncbi:MAG TPA: hypothetical protein DDZ38_04870 [Gammaproteobacteria bacterium]|nr:hypothetical protein [Gammaproteobacteria bacterium]